jgi:hypothetical protein
MGNMSVVFTKDANGVVTYAPKSADGTTVGDDTSPVFRKLSKQYDFSGYRDQARVADMKAMLAKIVDNNTLVGWVEKLHTKVSDPDVIIGGDAGLFELYENVVKRFVDGMIVQAERYAGMPPKDVAGPWPADYFPKDQWYSRGDSNDNGYGPSGCITAAGDTKQCDGEHGIGMSYSYGGKQTVKSFNDTVSKWKAPPSRVYGNIASLDDGILLYKGNIKEADGQIAVGESHKWAGLYSYRPGTNGTEYSKWAWRASVWTDKLGWDRLLWTGDTGASVCTGTELGPAWGHLH